MIPVTNTLAKEMSVEEWIVVAVWSVSLCCIIVMMSKYAFSVKSLIDLKSK